MHIFIIDTFPGSIILIVSGKTRKKSWNLKEVSDNPYHGQPRTLNSHRYQIYSESFKGQEKMTEQCSVSTHNFSYVT